MNRMETIGRKVKTDKVTHHQYHKYYERYLEPFYTREDASILEIGIFAGCSLRLWEELFPSFFIYGLDINATDAETERSHILRCDQGDPDALDRVVGVLEKNERGLCVVIDDGSHVPAHQVLTFNKLFPCLENGGVYIIEDIETSYWYRGDIYGYPIRCGHGAPGSFIEIMKQNVDCVNIEMCRTSYTPEALENTKWIESITFSRNCIIIIKGDPSTRAYRFGANTTAPPREGSGSFTPCL